jgi:hypothetical protein
MFDNIANQDFQRAINRASWRKILSRLTGSDNQLLPYDEVRARLPMRGQHYTGLHQVPIDKIVGSIGRYKDFDRAFLPIQNRTKDRWISIDKAHYEDVPLPPVELYKIGDIYFVKDGNHRVSVARERGQLFIDAYVTEIDIPITLSTDIKIDDLEKKEKQAEFMLETGLRSLRPEANIELSNPALYSIILEHIATHRWYLGIEQKSEIPYEEAVASWHDHVYLPLVEEIRAQDLSKSIPGSTEADLYLWAVEYEKYLRQAYSSGDDDQELAKAIAAQQLLKNFPESDVTKLIRLINRTNWLEKMILDQEQAVFFEKTKILELRPDAKIETTIPGKYDRLLDHIATHRWYLGEHRGTEASFEDAVKSWYDNVYMPIVQVIRDQSVLRQFPKRTETDLYLWIVQRQWFLREAYGEEVPIEKAAEDVTEQLAENETASPVKKVVDAIKKAAGKK